MGLKISNNIFFYLFFIFYLPLNLKLLSQPLFSMRGNDVFIADKNILKKDQVRTIEMSGIGFEIKDAIQDAAVKALQDIAGSFIDSETLYKNKSTIRNGIESAIEIYSEKIRDYSQGSIKSYKVLSTKMIGDQYEVKVRFEIRIEEFETYIKKLGYGSKKIKKGLFAKLAIETKESESKVGFLKKVVNPINRAEVYEIDIGDPITLKAFISPSKKGEKIVSVSGFGKSLTEASQNAAFQALTEVVGSLVDAETYFKYKEEINNAIIKETESFSYDVQEYSRGSITVFELIKKYKDDGIYKVDANITVGLDDFSTYLSEISAFGLNVDSYSDSICMNDFGYNLVCNKDFRFFTKNNLSTDNTFLIPFDISLKNSFLRNSEKILEKISNEIVSIDPSPFSSYNFSDYDPKRDHILSLIDLRENKPLIKKYNLKEVKSKLSNSNRNSLNVRSNDEIALYSLGCEKDYENRLISKLIEIQFLNEYGEHIKKIRPTCSESNSKGNFMIFELAPKNLFNYQINTKPLFSLYTRTNECNKKFNSSEFELCETQIITKRTFWLAFQLEDLNLLNQISEIVIRFID